jgi:hypothetical protein
MQNFAALMRRLLEIQYDERERSPELIADDEQLMDGLQKSDLAGKPPQSAALSRNNPERMRFKA